VNRILKYNQTFAAPGPIEFIVQPGNVEVVRGATVPLSVHTLGKPVSTVVLRTRQQGQAQFETRELRLSAGQAAGFENVFHDSVAGIKATTEYFASAEDIESEKYRITVIDRPLIRSFQVQLNYPAYTRLPAKALEENVGDVTAYPGTIVSINLASSKELASGGLAFSDKTSLPLVIKRTGATARFRLMNEKTYHVVLSDREGLTNADPIEYQLRLIPDAFPTIAILVPGRNVDVTEEMRLDLLLRISDDLQLPTESFVRLITNLRSWRVPDRLFSFVYRLFYPSKESWHELGATDMFVLHLV